MSPSARHLLLANAATLAFALLLHWPPGWLLWPYWLQSVVIGWYARRRMLGLERFSTANFTSSGRRVPEDDPASKRSTARFFALHYGAFHLAYLLFLAQQHPLRARWDGLVLIACGASFVLSQRETHAVQHAADLRGRPNLGVLVFAPYLRIVPMHLAIVLGSRVGGGTAMLVGFTALKTGADLLLDRIDRRIATPRAERAEAVPS